MKRQTPNQGENTPQRRQQSTQRVDGQRAGKKFCLKKTGDGKGPDLKTAVLSDGVYLWEKKTDVKKGGKR